MFLIFALTPGDLFCEMIQVDEHIVSNELKPTN